MSLTVYPRGVRCQAESQTDEKGLPAYQPRPILDADDSQLPDWVEADALRSAARTNLALWRLRRGLTQQQLAEAAGISPATLRRLERNEEGVQPGVRSLANLAIVLGVDLTDLIEDQWRHWHPTVTQLEPPADPRELWGRAPAATPDRPRIR